MCHRDRLKAWKPDDQLTRELATLNEGRRHAVDRRTELANEIKSELKLYLPVALQILDHDIATALAADLLVQWPTLAELQKISPGKLRKFFHGLSRVCYSLDPFLPLGSNLLSSSNRQRQDSPRGRTRAGL